jgi:hypothetical protein
MKIHLDIRHNIPPTIALQCVKQVIAQGKVSDNGKSYCYATTFDTIDGEVWVEVRPYRKSNCFLVYKNQKDKSL